MSHSTSFYKKVKTMQTHQTQSIFVPAFALTCVTLPDYCDNDGYMHYRPADLCILSIAHSDGYTEAYTCLREPFTLLRKTTTHMVSTRSDTLHVSIIAEFKTFGNTAVTPISTTGPRFVLSDYEYSLAKP